MQEKEEKRVFFCCRMRHFFILPYSFFRPEFSFFLILIFSFPERFFFFLPVSSSPLLFWLRRAILTSGSAGRRPLRSSFRRDGEESPDSTGREVLLQGGCRGRDSAERKAQQKIYRRFRPARVKWRCKRPPGREAIPSAWQAPSGARPNRG